MITGHQHSIFSDFKGRLKDNYIIELARSIRANGFRLVDCTCVGQDLQLRGEHYQDVFAGHVGNNFTSEAVLSTRAIDIVVSEFNCTIPGLDTIVEKYKVKMICLDDVAKKSNSDYIEFDRNNIKEITNHLINH